MVCPVSITFLLISFHKLLFFNSQQVYQLHWNSFDECTFGDQDPVVQEVLGQGLHLLLASLPGHPQGHRHQLHRSHRASKNKVLQITSKNKILHVTEKLCSSRLFHKKVF